MVYSASKRRKKNYQRYVPKLFPPQPEIISWGKGSKPAIIRLFEAGKGAEEISDITRNRISFVKSVIYRRAHSEEFTASVKKPKQRLHACYSCGTQDSFRWLKNPPIGEVCIECGKWLTKIRNRKPRQLPKWRKIPCKTCSKLIKVWPSAMEKGKKYCSIGCYRAARTNAPIQPTQSQSSGGQKNENMHQSCSPQRPEFCRRQRHVGSINE